VILNKVDKKLRRLSGAGHAAWFSGLRRKLTLVDKPFGQRPCDILCRLMRKILIIGVRFAGRENVGGVMKVIIPLGGKERRLSVLIARMEENHVPAVFSGEVDMAVGNSGADIFGYFYQYVPGGAIFNLIDSIKAQPIELVFGQPEQRRLGNILPHGLGFIGDSVTPRGHPVLMKKPGDSRER
jgi:hypothetical protein